MSTAALERAARELSAAVAPLRFGAPVTHVYNPLQYAWPLHRAYLRRYGAGRPGVILVGMNPGPWGMAQSGVPFGDVGMVRDWLGLSAPVARPDREHPKRPVTGLDCSRGEVSGRRLWGWARSRFGTPERFFTRFFVINYCPLAFMEESGRNRTPDKLPAAEREPLFAACDTALRRMVTALGARHVVGVGRFAADRAAAALGVEAEGHSSAGSGPLRLGWVPHPSPASPAANRGWDRLMDRALAEIGIRVPKAHEPRS